MMKRSHMHATVLLNLVLLQYAGPAQADQQGARPAVPRAAPYASVAAGQIRVKGHTARPYGPSNTVEVVTLWKYQEGDSDYTATIARTFGKGTQTTVNVPYTSYHLVLLDGAVLPVVLDHAHWTLWRLQGLGPHFSKSRSIVPGERSVTLRGPEGFADIDLIWTLDFSELDVGFQIKFDIEGGW